jgi:hypothetical protein
MRCIAAILLSVTAVSHAGTVTVAVDPTQDRRRVDPLIYGVNFGDAAQLTDPGFTVRRSGGNAETRYNWQVDVSNRGSDYFFLNVGLGTGVNLPDQSTANTFIAESLAAGVPPLVTIGTIGWTPLPDRSKRYGFAISKYGPQLRNGAPFDADGGNGECNVATNTTGWCVDTPGGGPHLIVGNDPADTSMPTTSQWARDWIAHLRTRHGAGAVRHFSLDNEVMLWNSTHRDVHPQGASYDEIWDKTVDYGTAIKQAEPLAQVFGPVTWGYCDLFTSAADGCLTGADRDAHGGLPFVRWYLRQVCAHQQSTGVRLVDYLDLHYYPQGDNVVDFGHDFPDAANPALAARRLRALKEMYDPDWIAESWFDDLGDFDDNHYEKPQFIRRVRAWIDAECPGTKLAITEYNWGPDASPSAALAQAELLAIFGREGVDLATRWTAPAPGSLVERAFRLFLDYDGSGRRVEGDSVRATSNAIDVLGAYAVDLPDERLMVLLFNKDTTPTTAQLSFAGARNGPWTLYRFDATTNVTAVASGTIGGTTISLVDLPPRSANLLVLPQGRALDRIFRNGFEQP